MHNLGTTESSVLVPLPFEGVAERLWRLGRPLRVRSRIGGSGSPIGL
jgi:hypothetical protein